MKHTAKKTMITVIGGLLVFIGVMFVIVPGPAILFLPAGLALLSLEYPWAKQWLKKCQRLMRKGAEQMDNLVVRLKRRSN
ncbi:PGPGW domain-containing protein [Thalassotalea euphylliae]|uniref:Tellurium resistance protein TerC n=1 Tax=Thalassotalea euphylliae TaxID=1655234 RepID=A0A3E0U4P2_9GAMM|nr:PGPGW domain-containing protein [Thalassotalea euphylliae]REL31690.1 tellurium resistance protein TerC [Thalassotalea euphylliae]